MRPPQGGLAFASPTRRRKGILPPLEFFSRINLRLTGLSSSRLSGLPALPPATVGEVRLDRRARTHARTHVSLILLLLILHAEPTRGAINYSTNPFLPAPRERAVTPTSPPRSHGGPSGANERIISDVDWNFLRFADAPASLASTRIGNRLFLFRRSAPGLHIAL